MINMAQKYGNRMRIKKRKPIIFIRSSHFPQKPLCNDIYPSFRTLCSRQNAPICHSTHTHFRHGRFYALPPAASAGRRGIPPHQSRSNRANRQMKISFSTGAPALSSSCPIWQNGICRLMKARQKRSSSMYFSCSRRLMIRSMAS